MSTKAIVIIIAFFSFMMFMVGNTLSESIDQVNKNSNGSFYDDLSEYE